MGRPRLPLACSKCGRTPKDGIKLLSNRYCSDCMRMYNKTKYIERKERYGLTDAQRRNAEMHIQILDADDDELVGSEEII